MSDGLTAEQEAERRYPEPRDEDDGLRALWKQAAFVAGAEWATEREEARAESAEARVAELERAVIWMSGSAEFGPGQPAHDHWVEIRDTLLFAPTTEAVTE